MKGSGQTIVNKGSVVFHWLSPCRERKVFLLPLGALLTSQGMRAPLFGLPTLFNRGFCWFIFHIHIWQRNFCLIQASVTWPGLFFVLCHKIDPNSPHVWLPKIRSQPLNPFPKVGIASFTDGFYSVSKNIFFLWKLFQPQLYSQYFWPVPSFVII